MPEQAKILNPAYSKLFQLGFTVSDTFLLLRDPADSLGILGAYCWGKGSDNYGFTRIKSRNKLAALSAVFTGMIEALHEQNRIIAVDEGNYITSPKTKKRIEKSNIVSVASKGHLQNEKLARLKPDLILAYFIDASGKSELEQLRKQGIPVIYIQNFLENHALGRAEWLLVTGALCGKLQEAEAMFAEITEHYESVVLQAAALKNKPGVICNAPFSGIWDVPSGESYMAKMIEDAGGKYVFSDTKGSGRIPLDIETVFQKSSSATFWLNPGPCRNKKCLVEIDKRLENFNAFQKDLIYNCTARQQENGANPWWEYGVIRPDIVLLDIFTILHPEVYSEHSLVFFEKIK